MVPPLPPLPPLVHGAVVVVLEAGAVVVVVALPLAAAAGAGAVVVVVVVVDPHVVDASATVEVVSPDPPATWPFAPTEPRASAA